MRSSSTLPCRRRKLGVAVDGARMDLTIAQSPGFQVLGPNSLVLEYDDGGTWTPVSLTSPAPAKLIGSIATPGTFDHEPGDEVVVSMRIATGSSVPTAAQLGFTFELVPDAAPVVVAPNPSALGSNRADTLLVAADREESSIRFGFPFQGGPVSPHTARQGYSFNLPGLGILPQVSAVGARGRIEVLLDGVPLPVSTFQTPNEFGPSVAVVNGSALPIAVIPSSTPTGARTLTVRYSGDANLKPSQADTTIYVASGLGLEYDCYAPGIPPIGFRALREGPGEPPPAGRAGVHGPPRSARREPDHRPRWADDQRVGRPARRGPHPCGRRPAQRAVVRLR